MNHPLTQQDVAAALQRAFEEDGVEVEARVDGKVVRRAAQTRTEPRTTGSVSAEVEEAEYRAFAASLGLDDEKPMRMVTMPKAEYDELKRLSDMLPELVRDRSRRHDWSAEEEREYRQWARGLGLE